jgi:hypothetical protein
MTQTYSLAHLPPRSTVHPFGLGPCDGVALAAIQDGLVVGLACPKGGFDVRVPGIFDVAGVGPVAVPRPSETELALAHKGCMIVKGAINETAKSFTPFPA